MGKKRYLHSYIRDLKTNEIHINYLPKFGRFAFQIRKNIALSAPGLLFSGGYNLHNANRHQHIYCHKGRFMGKLHKKIFDGNAFTLRYRIAVMHEIRVTWDKIPNKY